MKNNYMEMKFKSTSENEGFARTCVASFCLQLDPTLEEIVDIKTAVSEAVTNCVVHAYPKGEGEIFLRAEIDDDILKIVIADNGVGIKNIAKAREPFYTSKIGESRSGMGFTIMESFMDEIEVSKNDGKGVKVTLIKRIATKERYVGHEC